MASRERTSGPLTYGFQAFKFEVFSKSNCCVFPKGGHQIGADSTNLYCFGCYNPGENDENNAQLANSCPLFPELWRFNFATNTWHKYPNCKNQPMKFALNALCLHRNFLLAYGWTGPSSGFRLSNQLYLYQLNDGQCIMDEVQISGQIPSLYGQAFVYHNDSLYAIGGMAGSSTTCDIYRLNLKTKVCEVVYIGNGQGEYEPEKRGGHEVAFDGHNIYVLGGASADTTHKFLYLPVFNLEKAVWIQKKTVYDSTHGVPRPRVRHAAVQIKTNNGIEVYITGGRYRENLFDDIWRLNLTTLQWTYITYTKLPRPMYLHAAAVTPEGRMCIFGGLYKNQNVDRRRSKTIYRTWICIPKLSEMCWEALLYYFPHITDCPEQSLIDIGLPRHYVRRLGA